MKKLLFLALIFFACGNAVEDLTPVPSAEDAIMKIEAFQGDARDFTLVLDEELLVRGKKAKRDLAVGIIGKAIVKSKGWYFDSHEDRDNLRIYRFKQ